MIVRFTKVSILFGFLILVSCVNIDDFPADHPCDINGTQYNRSKCLALRGTEPLSLPDAAQDTSTHTEPHTEPPPTPCGNGTCQVDIGENCTICPVDCKCPNTRVCNNGSCIINIKCGDGTCDAAQGENCSTCTKDCPCPQNTSCQSGLCNGCLCFPGQLKCEGTKLSQCSADCKSWTLKETCAAGSNCDATKGQCISPCGDGNCDAASNENCQTCAKDCQCATNQICNGFQCVDACGDGKCNAGENCTTCPQDCACPGGAQCQNGACCTCTPGTIKCDGDALKTCKADCTGWESKQCKNGCQSKQCCACPAGKRRCSGDTVQECTCKEWKQVDKCGTFEKCKSGKCKFSLW